MSWQDAINSSFEWVAAGLIARACLIVYREKLVRGVSVLSTAFFTLWGAWNIYYYPTLGQWASFWGGILLMSVNATYVGLLLYYRRTEGDRRNAD